MSKEIRFLIAFLVISVFATVFGAPAARAQSAGAVLKKFDGGSPKEREQKLIEGAKKEGKVVVYSFTAVDQLKPLLEEFQKRYPFLNPEHYRGNATGVFNKY